MSVTVTRDKLSLVGSGFRGMCRSSGRISQLKSRTREIDGLRIARTKQMFFGLADRTRLMILELLAQEELCAREITAALDLTQPTTSHHLGILERVGLIAARRDGKWVFYRIANPKVRSLLEKSHLIIGGY